MINLLKYVEYGDSEFISIAKGKYKLATTWKEGFKQLKRDLKWLLKK